MKLQEIFSDEQLDEGKLKNMALAGLAGAAMFGAVNKTAHHLGIDHHTHPVAQQEEPQEQPDPYAPLAQQIAAEYRINPDLAYHIVELAHKYEKDTFPKAKDILAVIGTESSFNPKAVSQLKKDPARGLMQVRPGVWGLNPAVLNNIDDQVKIGSDILHQYYTKLKDKEAALHAYNMGITNFKRGKTNPRYVAKINTLRQRLADI